MADLNLTAGDKTNLALALFSLSQHYKDPNQLLTIGMLAAKLNILFEYNECFRRYYEYDKKVAKSN